MFVRNRWLIRLFNLPRNLLILFFSLNTLCLGVINAQAAMPSTKVKYEFLPPEGKTLLMIGQDKKTIDEYVDAVGIEPAGVMLYTSIQDVTGLDQPFDNGAGIHHGAYLAQRFPKSSLQIGLYMVDALDGVINGTFDINIDKLALWILDQKRPVYLRIGYEFDNPENKYDPVKYVSAYKKIVDRFRELGVDNVAYVWHSGTFMAGAADPKPWFPGIEYVDWFAVTLFAPAQYEQIKVIANMAKSYGKPLMIAETSPMGAYTIENKKEWFSKFFRIIELLEPQAVSYINNNWDMLPMWRNSKFGDARVEQSPELLGLWINEIMSPRYIHAR